MQPEDLEIPTRASVAPKGTAPPIDDSDKAWEEYAALSQQIGASQPLADKTPPPEVPSVDELFEFRKEEDNSIWDHPKLQGFFSFVETKLKQMHQYSKAVKDHNNITFYELNLALSNHFDVYTTLVGLYNTADIEREVVEMEFQAWFDSLYVVKRSQVNSTSLSAQKWSSAKEIEAMVRVENSEEYKERHLGVVAAKRQVQFLRRLIEGWEKFAFILQTMSKNIQTQYRGSSFDQ